MTFGIRIVLFLSSHYAISGLVFAASAPNRIPIGALLDMEIPQAKTGFTYKLDKHNNSSNAVLKLDKYEKEVNVSDPYEVKQKMCSVMIKGIFAFLGFANSSSLPTIMSYANKFHMPFVTPSATTSSTKAKNGEAVTGPGYILHMRPLYDMAILDIIKAYKWNRVFYLYDTSEGLDRVEKIFELVNSLKVQIEVVRVNDPTNSYELLRKLDSRYSDGHKYIVLDISTVAGLRALLNQIQNVGMNRKKYHYILGGLTMDEIDLTSFKHGGVNITGFRLLNRENQNVQTIQREWTRLSRANPSYWRDWRGMDEQIMLDSALTMDAVDVIVKALEHMQKEDPQVFKKIFRRGTVWNNGTRGIPCDNPPIPWTIGDKIMEELKSVTFDGITGPVAFDENGFRKGYQLDILEMGLESDPKTIGSWDNQKGLTIIRSAVPQPPTTNKNTTKIVTTILTAPYLMLKKQPEDGLPLIGNDRYEGYCVDLVDKVAQVVNFDYVLKVVKDNKYGTNENDGTWNGMVGELTREEAHLAVAPLTINSKRQRVIDFSKPFMNLGISIMIKKPEKQKPGVFSFMDPLSSKIWMCIVFSYVAVSIVLFLVSRFSPYEWQIEDSVNGPTFTNDFTILNSLWFSLGAFMRQGCGISPRLVCCGWRFVIDTNTLFITYIPNIYYCGHQTVNIQYILYIRRTCKQNADDSHVVRIFGRRHAVLNRLCVYNRNCSPVHAV